MANRGDRPKDRLRLAVFDCDGTLVDSQAGIIAAMREAWRDSGLAEPDPASIRRIVGLSVMDAVVHLHPLGTPEQHLALAERYKTAFRESRLRGEHVEPLFPGIVDAIGEIERAGILLGIATGKSRRGLVATLERHGLLERFVTLQTADTGPGKPHPDMVHRAMAEAGVEAADTVVIGDTTYDMMMARSAGAAAIGVAWGYHEAADLEAAGAHAVCRICHDVPATVARLLTAVAGTMGNPE